MKKILGKLLLNKNVVTILALAVLVVILYAFYSKRIEEAIEPVTVPYAKTELIAGTHITADKVGSTIVPKGMVDETVISLQSSVIDKYVACDVVIPKGSLFYTRSVAEKEAIPANIILDIKEDEMLYYMRVDIESSYGNSIYPGNYIDIYLKATTASLTETAQKSDQKVVLGKLLSNIQIISVRDYNGKPVFENLEEKRTPAYIIFAVPEEYFVLLKKSEFLRTYNTELIPVPTDAGLNNEPVEFKLSSQELKDWINSVTYWTSY